MRDRRVHRTGQMDERLRILTKFNGYTQCEVLVYMKHLPKPCRFMFGDDDELGQAFFARLKAELNHEHVSEMIDIDDIIGHIKNIVS